MWCRASIWAKLAIRDLWTNRRTPKTKDDGSDGVSAPSSVGLVVVGTHDPHDEVGGVVEVELEGILG
jgi:hypothetical protein